MLVCVSRGSFSCGQAFAESLAQKLGCPCLGREELLDLATEAGVAAGKLELACLRPRGMNERMVLEREHFQAFASSYLAARALEGPLVYHGRTGHLLLQNVPHVLRVRVVADIEERIRSVEERLGLDRVRAKRYIDEVEEDRRRWVRTFYNVDWDTVSNYDVTINVGHASVANMAAAFCKVTELPEFQETPAGHRALEDLELAGRCRVALAKDDRTYAASFRVRAERGVVTVTYQPRHEGPAKHIVDILTPLAGVRRVLPTMATTRVLWIQERFEAAAPTFEQILDLADRWEAAVELIQLRPADDGAPIVERADVLDDNPQPSARAATGGIEDDADVSQPEVPVEDDGGLEEAFTKLVSAGRAGGRATVRGGINTVVDAVDGSADYSLAVVGDVFLDKGKAARLRMSRELCNALNERLRVAVIQAEEMKEQYLFGMRQLVVMLVCFGLVALTYLLIFRNQDQVLRFLTREGTRWRVLAAACVTLFVPIIAFTYGKATHYLLKLIRME